MGAFFRLASKRSKTKFPTPTGCANGRHSLLAATSFRSQIPLLGKLSGNRRTLHSLKGAVTFPPNVQVRRIRPKLHLVDWKTATTQQRMRTKLHLIQNRATRKTVIRRIPIATAARRTVLALQDPRATTLPLELGTIFAHRAKICPNFSLPLTTSIDLNRPRSPRNCNPRATEGIPNIQGVL